MPLRPCRSRGLPYHAVLPVFRPDIALVWPASDLVLPVLCRDTAFAGPISIDE